MTFCIGLWLLSSGLVIFLTFLFGFELELTDKISMIALMEILFTGVIFGCFLITGGE